MKKAFSFLVLSLALFTTPSFAAPTEAQKDAFMEIMNADPQTGAYSMRMNIDSNDFDVEIAGKAEYDAQKKEALGKMLIDMNVRESGESFDIVGDVHFYANEKEAAVKVENVEDSMGLTNIMMGTDIPQGTWFPVPQEEYADMITEFKNTMTAEEMKSENIVSLRVKERAKYTQYVFVTKGEDEETGSMIKAKGIMKVYTSGKQQVKVSITPTVESITEGMADMFSLKMKYLFTPKNVSIVKPY